MELTLKVVGGTHDGKEIRVKVPKFFIGRAEDCHLRPSTDLISRHHCALILGEGLAAVRDFGSKNGTFVNDERVAGERKLRNGDRLKVGQLEFEVQLTQSLGGQKKPKVKDVKDVAARTADTKRGVEENVADWLSDDTQASEDNTQTINAADTENLVALRPKPNNNAKPAAETKAGLGDTAAMPAPQPAKKAVPAPKSGDTAERVFGKLPTGPVTTTKDSREAAAEMLKKIFKNR